MLMFLEHSWLASGLLFWLQYLARCDSHLSFVFTWTSSTWMSDFDLMTFFWILIITFMLKCCDLLNRCMSLYFCEANVASWVFTHHMQMLWVTVSVLQFFFVLLLYASKLMSFTKFTVNIFIFCVSMMSKSSALKKKKKMNNTEKL